MTTTRIRTATATVLLGAAALALTACGASNQHVPSAGRPAAGGASTSATTAAPSQPSSAAPTSYSPVGDFSAAQVQVAVETAQDAVAQAQSGDLVSDLKTQSTDERLSHIDSYLTADARAYLADPKNASALEAFVLDPGTNSGEEVTAYDGPTISNVTTTISTATGDLVVTFHTDAPITTDQSKYDGTRDYTLDMVQATGAQHAWLIQSVDHVTGNLSRTGA